MIRLDLTYQEAETLHKVLCEHRAEIALEMSTHGIEDFAELLKQESASIEYIIDQIEIHGIGVPAEMFGGYSE